MGEVTITVPAEHAPAVRDELLETLGLMAGELEHLGSRLEQIAEWLREGTDHSTGEIQFKATCPGDRLRLRDWAKDARRDADETLATLDDYIERDEWEQRSRSLLAVSEQVLERVED